MRQAARLLALLLLALLGQVAAVEVPDLDLPPGAEERDQVLPALSAAGVAEDLTTPRSAAGVGRVETTASDGLTLSVSTGEGDGLSNAIKLLLLITVLSVAPGFLMMTTSFARIIIVFGFLRRALGTNTLPPNQVVLGLALFLTMFVMAPTFTKVHSDAIVPYMDKTISETEAMQRAGDAVREFMGRHTRKSDLALFVRLSGAERPNTLADVPFTTLVPAFITSELKTAFQMGFVLFLPFLVIDLVVAAVLMSLGMMMLPPVIVSLPFKILLFVLVDGWTLLVQSLAASYA